MRRPLQALLLGAYRVVFARGLLRTAWGRTLFERLYALYKAGFEAGPIRQLRRFVPPGGTVIDVGANIGFFTRRFAEWVGPDGRVVALEPEAENFRRLSAMLARSGLAGRVEARRAVADAAPGEVRLAVNPDHPGDHKIATSGAGVAVDAVTLDAVAGGRPVDLVKIDVQGAEMRVLDGGGTLLATTRPVLFVEVDPGGLQAFGTSAAALFERLDRLGYAPHRLTRRGAEPLGTADLDRLFDRSDYVDLLFLPRDPAA